MADFKSQDTTLPVIDGADHAIVADPVTPQPTLVTDKSFTAIPRIRPSRSLIHIIDDW